MARSGVVVAVNKERLREARLEALMTQRELGASVGMTHLQISRLECGTQHSTANNLRRIADTLGVSVEELLR